MHNIDLNARVMQLTVNDMVESSFLVTKYGAKLCRTQLPAEQRHLQFNPGGDHTSEGHIGDYVAIIRELLIVLKPDEAMKLLGQYIIKNVLTEELVPDYDKDISDDDDIYTLEDFKANVDCGGFIDYDGCGHPVKNGKYDVDWNIYPSTFPESMPKDATHVIWYNR